MLKKPTESKLEGWDRIEAKIKRVDKDVKAYGSLPPVKLSYDALWEQEDRCIEFPFLKDLSTASVESTFSVAKEQLGDRRINMKARTMADKLLIKSTAFLEDSPEVPADQLPCRKNGTLIREVLGSDLPLIKFFFNSHGARPMAPVGPGPWPQWGQAHGP
ncbi:hypothetical protein Pmar_PMAR027418, partial [Perkinsus marinus ATCC 50983]